MGFDPLDFVIMDEVTKASDFGEDNDWRDKYIFNEYDLDPDDYDSEEEFLDAMEEAEVEAEIEIDDDDEDEEGDDSSFDDDDEDW